MTKPKIAVTEQSLDKFVKDHGLDKPLKPGELHVINRNGETSTFNLAEEVKKLEAFLRGVK